MVKNLSAMRETWVRSLGWEDPLEEGMATHSSILAWRIPMDRGSWQATVHGVTKSWTWLSDETQHSTDTDMLPQWFSRYRIHLQVRSHRRHGFDPWVRKITLEEDLATHSSILAWRISWTGKPDGPQSIGPQRVRHDWSNLAQMHKAQNTKFFDTFFFL